MGILSKRADRPVDSGWLATAVGLLQIAHSSILVDRKVVALLADFLTWQWRQGRTPREAVAMTCAARGQIVPSSGSYAPEPKVRPPKDAKAGDVFGADEIRETVQVMRLTTRIETLQQRLDDERQRGSLYTARLAAARTVARREELREKQVQAESKAAALQDKIDAAKAEAKQAARRVDTWQQHAKPTVRRPAAARPAQAAACPPNQAGCKLGLLGGVCGLPAPLVLAAARGTPIPQVARFCLTSADKLIPSHDARRGFAKRADYPEEVQEREYDRDKAEQYKVVSTAQNLIPELIFNGAPGAIDGLPVVTKEGIVLGGNGRTQALQLHYAQGGQTAKDYLLDHAAQFGFTDEQIAKIADPIIVRVVQAPEPDAPEFRRAAQELVRLLNIPLTQGLGVRAEAVAEARRISNEVLEILSVALAADTSLAEYLSSRASRSLVDALRRAGVLTDRNSGRLLGTDGIFSEDGKRYVERLITAAVIPDAVLLDQLGPGVVATLAAGAPWLLSAAASGEEWDLRKPLRSAARDLADLRGRQIESVDAFLRQGGLFGKPATSGDAVAESLLKLLFDLSRQPNRFRAFARRFAALASQNPINQSSLFETETVSPREALKRALEAN